MLGPAAPTWSPHRAEFGSCPGGRPAASDLNRPLRLFASQGEREAKVVGVLPLRTLKGAVDLKASDLTGPDGAVIKSSAVDVRYVRYLEYPVPGGYELRPHFLERRLLTLLPR